MPSSLSLGYLCFYIFSPIIRGVFEGFLLWWNVCPKNIILQKDLVQVLIKNAVCFVFENSPTRPTLLVCLISLFAARWQSSFRVKLFLKIVCVRISRSFLETLLQMRFLWFFSRKFTFPHTYSKIPRPDLVQKILKAQYLKY